MNTRFLICLLTVFSQLSAAYGQLKVEDCQEKARANYPQIKQFGLIQRSADYNLSNAGKAWLPQVSLSVRATYQSEATSINIPAM